MGLQLRTGKNGKNVTSDSDGRLYAGIAGTDRYVLDDGNKLAASLSDSNTLVVQSGAMLINGRHVTLDGTQTWNIPNGAQGKKRSNLCVVRYAKDSNGTEIAEAVTLSGDLTDGDPVDPAYNNTSILQNGTTISDYPLYRVITDGISANDPVPLFNVLTPLATIGASVDPKTSDGWTYFKLDSGIVISFGMFSVTTTGSSSWGSVTELTPAFKKALPIQLVSPPLFEMAQAWGAGSGLIGVEVYGDDNDIKTHTRKYQALRPSGADGVPSGRTLYFKVINIGRWK